MTVEVPCRIGDKMWGVKNFYGSSKPMKGVVSEMMFNDKMEVIVVIRSICRGKFGESVFSSEAECQKECDRCNARGVK